MTAVGKTLAAEAGRAIASAITARIEASGLSAETQAAIQGGLASFSLAVASGVLGVCVVCPKADQTMATSLLLGAFEEALAKSAELFTAASAVS